MPVICISREEIANVLTHGIGVIAALVGSSVLITLAAIYGDSWQLASVIVFGITLLLLYTASTLYHAIQYPALKRRLQVLDHCAIYLLIAGTYTPFTFIGLRGPWGWGLFAAIWGIALIGVIFKLFYTGRFDLLSTIIYIAMGWLVVIVIKPMWQNHDGFTLFLLFAGGLFYTLGTFFYHRESIPYSHAIWHLFVLAGSTCHFVSVAAQIV